MSSPYKAGYRRFKWQDLGRNRAVRVDIWFPTAGPEPERALPFGLGEGRAILDAGVAANGAPFPLVVISPAASGLASNYSWLAEYLARHGVVAAGVSHAGESWLYGPEVIDTAVTTRVWARPPDCSFAITQLLAHDDFRHRVDADRIAAIGHSSGGTTAIALAGAVFDPSAFEAYCQSDESRADCGCDYARQSEPPPPMPPEATSSFRDSRIGAVVMLDPAAGPGYSAEALAEVDIPVFVVGSVHNDVLPFDRHAGHYAAALSNATLLRLSNGEGHFVYLNTCVSDLAVHGVPLCLDRDGVDRAAVHARLAPEILKFVRAIRPSPPPD